MSATSFEPVARPRPWPATIAIMDLATAWTQVKVSDAAMMSASEHKLTLAVKAIEVLGDHGGPCPSRVLIAARSVSKLWLEASPERKAGKLRRAVDGMIDAAMAYVAGTIDEPVEHPAPLDSRMRAAGERD